MIKKVIIIICSLLVILLVSCKKQESFKDVQTSTPDTTNEFTDIDNDNIKEPPGDIQTSTPDSLNGPAAKNKDNTLKGDIPNKYKNVRLYTNQLRKKCLKGPITRQTVRNV